MTRSASLLVLIAPITRAVTNLLAKKGRVQEFLSSMFGSRSVTTTT
jgi:hypothetical protein